jgi:hypothetical protein
MSVIFMLLLNEPFMVNFKFAKFHCNQQIQSFLTRSHCTILAKKLRPPFSCHFTKIACSLTFMDLYIYKRWKICTGDLRIVREHLFPLVSIGLTRRSYFT